MDRINTRIKLKRDTTKNWERVQATFIPLEGEMIIYTDYREESYLDDKGEPQTRYIPAIKIGTGNAYLGDLQFAVVTPEEIAFWNNKLNVDEDVVNEKLIFTRN